MAEDDGQETTEKDCRVIVSIQPVGEDSDFERIRDLGRKIEP